MSLHNGIDTVAYSMFGCYSKTYGSTAPGTLANLFISLGIFEDAPNITINIVAIVMSYFRRRFHGN